MNNKKRLQKYYLSRGFTLVELMLAMTLGIFLIAGVSTVYISGKQTYKLRDQTSELDESARVVMRALKQHIEHAGYASDTGMSVANYIIPTSTAIAATSCADGNPNIRDVDIIETATDGAANVGGDTIGLRYMADDQLNSDCTGSSLAADSQCLPPASANREASYVYNSFSIANSGNNTVGDAIPALRCGGSLNAVRQPWAEGIENVQFQYGIDSNGDRAVNNYWTATEVEAAAAWESIIAVRIGLLVRSVEPVFDQAVSEDFEVLDQVISTSDRYRRNIYTTTVRLKNVARRSE